MFKRFARRLETIKQRHMDELLIALLWASDQQLSVEALGERTHLRSVAYPLLARLHQQGMVDPVWTHIVGGIELSYRLSDAGLNHARRLTGDGHGVTPSRTAAVVKPLVARVATWVGRIEVN